MRKGRYPQRSNVNNWTQAKTLLPEKGRNMNLEEVTLAEALQGAGYKTALFGKWHLGAHPDHGPKKQGFDEFFGLRGGFIDNYNHHFLHGKGFYDLFEGTKEVYKKGTYFPDLVTDRALDFIDQNKSNPFFLYLAYNIPHYPEQADKKFDERYKNMPMPRRDYAKMVSTTDDHIGQILKQLKKHQLTNDTIVIFMSDNGHSAESMAIRFDYHLSGLPKGTNYGANGGGGNTGKWRGHKGTFLEGGIRVPAILSYPARLPKGEVRNQAITAMDWMPTILELCKIEKPNIKFDGKALTKVIASPSAPSPHQVMHWQWRDSWMVREGNWKLLGKADTIEALYNLDDENPEEKNHLQQKPELKNRLKTLHDTWQKEVTPTK